MMKKNNELTKPEKEEKLINVISKVAGKENGNRVRHLVRIVANAYDNDPKRLKRYFNDSELIAGLATSAYHFLTGDIKPIQTREYGGLGAIINDSEHNLEFGRCQLWFSRLSGNALTYSTNKNHALRYSENSDKALFGSTNSDKALSDSINSGYALHESVNSGSVLWDSTILDNALGYSKNSDSVLSNSKILNQALYHSKNSDGVLYKSNISSNTLLNSENTEEVQNNINEGIERAAA